MIFNTLYAWAENLQLVSVFFATVLLFIGAILAFLRKENEIDRDDWQALMLWVVPMFIICLPLTMLPDLEHIKKVRDTLAEVVPPKPINEEKPNESPITLSPASARVLGVRP